jgi:sarcosine oxidase subunit beta
VKPVLDTVMLSLATGLYISQSDKGGLVFGGALDAYPSYAQRGNTPTTRQVAAAVADQMPSVGRVRLARHWAGIVDVSPDASPIVGLTPFDGLYLNCGWGTGGFKATPGIGSCFADTIANDAPHRYVAPFTLDRFTTGALVDEHGAAAVAH